jgi:hypothetical protein
MKPQDHIHSHTFEPFRVALLFDSHTVSVRPGAQLTPVIKINTPVHIRYVEL